MTIKHHFRALGAAPCSSDHPRAARTHPAALLIPRDIDGLLVAGRRISGSHVAHSSYRVTPIGSGAGQAAGV